MDRTLLGWHPACRESSRDTLVLLRLIRKHPVTGLILALGVEAWLAIPGEAMIAVAASALVARAGNMLRMLACAVLGMLLNDLALFGLSRLGRGVLVDWIGVHSLHVHLSAEMVMGAKFVPPLRSAAYIIYGLQGVPLIRFLEVSILSSVVWISLYALLGQVFHGRIAGFMERVERGGHWTTVAEWALTAAVLAVIWL